MRAVNRLVVMVFSVFVAKCLAGIIIDKNALNHSEQESPDVVVTRLDRLRKVLPIDLPFLFADNKSTSNDSCADEGDDGFSHFLTQDQQKQGGIVLCFMIAIYCFTLLAIVCDKYFLPSIERLCEVLNISADVGAATFMSVATSCPELFTNVVATFMSRSSLGIGTIVGSSMFNSLGVASIGSLAAARPIQLDWWPVTRDVSIYMIAISALIIIVWDNVIYWYEGLTLFILYFVYFIVMFQNPRVSRFVRRTADRIKNRNKVMPTTGDAEKDQEEKQHEYNRDSIRISRVSAYGPYSAQIRKSAYENSKEYQQAVKLKEEEDLQEIKKSPFKIPKGGFWTKFVFFYTWPIKMALRCTMPNPKVYPKLFPVSFLMCIVWIGTNSYVVSWMITIIGNVLGIPSTVQGMTFVAFGGSLPESLSIAIMSRRGEGKMGVSNSLGANTMNILFSLGMPWFFQTILIAPVKIQSGSITYTIVALIGVAIILYATLFINKFRLSRLTGSILVPTYITCVVLACLSEMVFFPNKGC